jgi:flagellar assembly factor FliW
MLLESSRFGRLEIADDAVVDFPNGLIGLGGRRFALLARGEEAAFIWLHATDDPALAVPLTNPWRFFASYEVELSDLDAARLGAGETSVYVTIRAAEAMEDVSANLRAPILIADGTGHQVLNQAPYAPVRAPLFEGIAVAPRALAA